MRKCKQKGLIPPLKLFVFPLSSPPLGFKNGFLTTNCIFCIPPHPPPLTDHVFLKISPPTTSERKWGKEEGEELPVTVQPPPLFRRFHSLANIRTIYY